MSFSLKFNCKMGGTDHIVKTSNGIDKLFEVTMVMGADVTHPGPGMGKFTPSLAAVVSSYSTDLKFSSQYLGSARMQESRMEFITELDGMVAERVDKWVAKNDGNLPGNILFYRDGVSESQFEIVKTLEFEQIRQGFGMAAKNCGISPILDVKITLLVVGKRHHT